MAARLFDKTMRFVFAATLTMGLGTTQVFAAGTFEDAMSSAASSAPASDASSGSVSSPTCASGFDGAQQDATSAQADINSLKSHTSTAIAAYKTDWTANQTANPDKAAADVTSGNADKSCQSNVLKAVTALEGKMSSANTEINTQVCQASTQFTKDTNGGVTGRIGSAHASGHLMHTGMSALSTYQSSVPSAFVTAFGSSQRQAVSSNGTPDTSSKPSTSDGYAKCSTMCPGADSQLVSDCNAIAKDFDNEIADTQLELGSTTNAASTTWTATKVALGVGAAAVGLGIYELVKSHDEAKTKQQIQNDYNNGIIDDSSGHQVVNCLQASTYTESQCQPVLINYCTNPNNTAKAGCGAFNNFYCGTTSTTNESYCLYGTSTTYCAQAGTGISSSPACQWLAMRPSDCSTNPTDTGCLSTMTSAQLTSLCPSYPNDPLCTAFNAGAVVNTGGTGTVPVTTTTTTGSTLTTVVGVSDPITGTTVTTGTGTVAGSTSSGSTGLTIKAVGKPVSNVWANNTSTLSSLCSNGALTGCGSSSAASTSATSK